MDMQRRSHKVSVVIPVYRTEQYIARCLESAFGQSLREVEFILVNDCTPDCSMVIVDKLVSAFPERIGDIRIVNHSCNSGAAVARNSGLDAASGEYVIFLDSDDYVELSMLEDMYDLACEKGADVIIADYYINYPGRQLYCCQSAPERGRMCAEWILSGRLHSSMCNKLVKRMLYMDHGISFTEGVDMWEDMSVMPRICFFADQVAYLPRAYLHYVQYNIVSYTSNINDKAIDDIRQVVRILDDFFSSQICKNEFVLPLIFLKLHAKSDFVIHTCGDRRKRLMELYPDADRFIGKHPTLSFFYKAVLRFGIHRLFWLVDCLVTVYFFIKKMYLKVRK